MTIRAYSAADKNMLSPIWYLASLEAHDVFGAARLQEQRKLIENMYLTLTDCLNDRPVDFVGLPDTFVGGLFVKPSVQGHGIGRQLIAHPLGRRGLLILEIYADNVKAYSFCCQLGFREIPARAKDDDELPFENIPIRPDG